MVLLLPKDPVSGDMQKKDQVNGVKEQSAHQWIVPKRNITSPEVRERKYDGKKRLEGDEFNKGQIVGLISGPD